MTAAWPIGCNTPVECLQEERCGTFDCPHAARDISTEVNAYFAPEIERQRQRDLQPVAEVVAPIVAAACARQPASGHVAFPFYLDLMQREATLGILGLRTQVERIICDDTGCSLSTLRTLGERAYLIATGRKMTL